MSIAKYLLPGFIKAPYFNIKKRVESLETSVRCLENAIDAMIVSPNYVDTDDVGFNGQRCRKRIFADIISAIPIDGIVETGTWVGNTTGYMATTARKPIYSCELSPRFHALSKMRLRELQGLHLEQCDSRRFLEKLSRGDVARKSVFFYLDAHWYEDLPLNEEVGIIANHWREFVIMIDDFKVPDDPGYGYDDYGPGKALTIDLLIPLAEKHHFGVYFPAARSSEETGGCRGCVVLASTGIQSDALSRLSTLRQWHNL
jgi:hypothetical protein